MDLHTYPLASAGPFRSPGTQQSFTVFTDILFLGFASYGSLVIFAPSILTMSRSAAGPLLIDSPGDILLCAGSGHEHSLLRGNF